MFWLAIAGCRAENLVSDCTLLTVSRSGKGEGLAGQLIDTPRSIGCSGSQGLGGPLAKRLSPMAASWSWLSAAALVHTTSPFGLLGLPHRMEAGFQETGSRNCQSLKPRSKKMPRHDFCHILLVQSVRTSMHASRGTGTDPRSQ